MKKSRKKKHHVQLCQKGAIFTLFILFALSARSQGNSATKDTIVVGINNQMIKVTPPEINNKIRVVLDDSLVTYQIEITKLSNKKVVRSPKEDKSGKVENNKSEGKKTKTFQYKYFSEMELVKGVGNIGFGDRSYFNDIPIWAYSSNYATTTEHRYNFTSFSKANSYFLNFTLREKTRSYSKKSNNLYARNTIDLGIFRHSLVGNFSSSRVVGDSVIENFSTSGRVNIYNINISKRWIQGIFLNAKKDMSLELGLTLGLIIPLAADMRVNAVPEWTRDILNVTQSLTKQVMLYSYTASPVRLNSALFLGYNYKRVSINARLGPQLLYHYPRSFSNVYLGLGYKI